MFVVAGWFRALFLGFVWIILFVTEIQITFAAYIVQLEVVFVLFYNHILQFLYKL